MRRLVRLLLLLAAACGPPRSEDGRVHVRFLASPDAGGTAKELAARFEREHPNLAVDIVEGPADSDTRENMYASSLMAKEDVYDLVLMDVAWIPTLAARGWLRPLDERVPAADRRRFLESAIEGATFQGKLYGLPLQADGGVLYYRKDRVSPPRTWAELASRGFVFQGKQYEGLVCVFLEALRGFGGDLLDAAGRARVADGRGVAALTSLVDGIKSGAIPKAVLTFQEEETRRAFQEGRALFMRNWPYAWRLMQAEGSPVRGKIGLAPLPPAPDGSPSGTLGGWHFGLSAYSKHPEEAWLVASYFASEEAQKLAYERSGILPSRKSLYSGDDFLRELYPVLRGARPRPALPRWPRVSDALQRQVSAALAGAEPPDGALRRAAREIDSALGEAR